MAARILWGRNRNLFPAIEIELWPGQSVSNRKDSICYLLGVANRNVLNCEPSSSDHLREAGCEVDC
jgi:hypothetical protein